MRNFSAELRKQIGDQSAVGRFMGDSAGSGLESSLLSAAKKAAIGLAAVFAGAKLLDFAGGTLKIGGEFQKQEVAFEALIGDAQLAQSTLDELADFAKTTPFDFPEIAEAARKFLSFGRTADELIPILTNVGNAAAVLGANSYDVNLVTRALGQIGSKGRVQLEELNQIAEAFPGINPIQVLADGIGVSTAEFTTALSKPGGALLEFGLTGKEAVDLLIEGFGEFRGAAGAMERQSRTLPGAISNLKDTFFLLRAEVSRPFLQPVADFISDSFIPVLDSLAPVLVSLGNKFAAAANPVIATFGERLPGAVAKFIATLKAVAGAVTGNKALASFAREFGGAVRGIAVDLREMAAAFRAGFAGDNDIAGGWLSVFEDVGRKVADLRTWFTVDVPASFDVFREQFRTAGSDIAGGGLDGAIGGIRDKLRDLFDLVKENPDAFKNLALATGVAGAVAGGAAVAAPGGVTKTATALTPILGGLASAAGALPGPVLLAAAAISAIGAAAFVAYKHVPAFQEAVDRVRAAFEQGGLGAAVDQIVVEFEGLVPKIIPALDRAKDAIGAWVTGTAVPFLKAKAPEWATAFLSWLGGVDNFLDEKLTLLMHRLGDWITDKAIPFLREQAPIWGHAITDWILDVALPLAGRAIVALVQEMARTAKEHLPGLSDKFVEFTAAIALIMFGFVQGVFASIVEHVAQWAVALLGWAGGVLAEMPARLAGIATAVFDWVTGMVPQLVEKVSGWVGAFFGWIADVVASAPARLEEIATAVLGFVGGLPDRIKAAASGMWDGIADAFRGAINAVIGIWNGLEFVLPGLSVDLLPGLPGGQVDVSGFSLRPPQIAKLASGAVLNSPTLAWLGEVPKARPEIVTPEALMRQVVRDAIAEVGVAGSGGGPLVGTVNVTEPVRPAEFVDEMNARLGWMLTTRNER